VVLFAVLRAAAVATAVGIAFGLHLPNASWLPIATIVATKASLQQSTVVAEQRLAGTVLGAALAILLLLTVNNRLVLEGALVVLSAVANSIRYVNYALYTAAVAATVLIAMDVPRPPTSRPRRNEPSTPSSAWESASAPCSSRACSSSAPPMHHDRQP
jgi:uncharacterized membrane protein YccC